MSPRTTDEIVQEYFNDLQLAFDSGKVHPVRLHLAEDVVLVTPHNRIETKAKVLKNFEEKLLPNVDKMIILKHYSDRGSACTIYEYVTKAPHIKIPTVAWHKVKDGVIYEIHIYFDTALWDKMLAGRQRKAG
ncbi:MAG: nuclear transport factor 2 family protein [Chlamydiales bacterium]